MITNAWDRFKTLNAEREAKALAPRLRVLVGCEESGKVREAFRKRGHDAWSNDIIDARDNSPFHLKMCVKVAIAEHGPWDIIILHPPCTALAVSGNSTYGNGMKKNDERHKALKWTKEVWDLACGVARKGVCLENPVGVLWAYIGVIAQYVHPYWFGHPEQKITGLALHGLPKLKETNNVYAEMMKLPKNKRQRLHYLPPSADRAKIRSETFAGIAEAFADQWGAL